MALRNIISIRGFHTTRCLFKSILADSYKSSKLWDDRLKCPHLTTNKTLINSINDKIIMGNQLNNVELDVFINIASPSIEDVAQLKESVIQLNKLRRSVEAVTIIPSTHHSLCRLFLYSQCLPSLVHILENRVDYGIFPDLFILNILIDESLDKENLVSACKLASLVMLQEEFGLNSVTDTMSNLSVMKYIMSKTDFSDWVEHDALNDKIFKEDSFQTDETALKEDSIENKTEEKNDHDDDDQDDAEYIRVPFLRNPYDDQHFDLKNPRLICGKILRSAKSSLTKQDKYLSDMVSIFGSILEGQWSEVLKNLEDLSKCKERLPLGAKDVMQNYVNNLHEVNKPSEEEMNRLQSSIVSLEEDDSLSLVDKLESLVKVKLPTQEQKDVEELAQMFAYSSDLRSQYQRLRGEKSMKKKLVADIEAKKEELKAREQYLYFYDNLKKSTLTKIDYK